MGEPAGWLNSPWVEALGLIGGVSGLASAGWTVWLFRREERRKLLDRLSITTHATRDGFLKLEIAFSWEDHAEPLGLEITVKDPRGAVAIYNAVTHKVSDGQGGWKPAGVERMQSAEKITVPLHFGPSSLKGTTTVFLAKIGDGVSDEKIDSGTVIIRVVTMSSRKRLISTTKHVSAAA